MKDKLLAAKGELDRKAGELLAEKPWKHVAGQSLEEMGKSEWHCCSCGARNYDSNEDCPVCPTADTSDANVAFKLRDMAVEKVGLTVYHNKLYRMYQNQEEGMTSGWDFINWLIIATPQQISQAAITALQAQEARASASK